MTELLTKQEVAKIYGVSSVTVDRWLAATRQGRGNFPLPRTPRGSKQRWAVQDLENWYPQTTETIIPVPQIITPATKKKRVEQTAKELEKFGITTIKSK